MGLSGARTLETAGNFAATPTMDSSKKRPIDVNARRKRNVVCNPIPKPAPLTSSDRHPRAQDLLEAGFNTCGPGRASLVNLRMPSRNALDKRSASVPYFGRPALAN